MYLDIVIIYKLCIVCILYNIFYFFYLFLFFFCININMGCDFMNFVFTLIVVLFVFLGIFIGKKFNLKYFSINSIFGLFLVNGLYDLLLSSNFLSINYHNSTWFYLVLCGILGFVIMKLIGIKSDNPDDVSIVGFSFINCFFLLINKFSLVSFLISCLYYILIGIYIKDTKSYLYVFLGFVLAFISSFLSNWMFGFLFSTLVGFFAYFLFSIYILVTRNSQKMGVVGLIVGFVVGLLGGIL